MNKNTNIEILLEDRVKLTKDQRNLILLAIDKQLPIVDAEYLEDIKKHAQATNDPYIKVKKYFKTKYGDIFGSIYLATIIDGDIGFQKAVHEIEKARAKRRIEKDAKD